jgi:C4-dicarboxylate-specific signal transduction histidine kinase
VSASAAGGTGAAIGATCAHVAAGTGGAMCRGMLTSEASSEDAAVAAALCHELNQPLTCLLSSLERAVAVLRRKPLSVADQTLLQLARSLADANATAQHLVRVVAEVHGQARKEPRTRRQLDLRAAVRAAAAMAQGSDDSIEISIDAPEAAWVDGIDTRLVHVFVELFAEALAEDPALVARMRRTDDEVVTELRYGAPRSSSKADARVPRPVAGPERGLDRALVRQIVAAHGGRLESWPCAGAGTLVRVTLPLAARTAPRVASVTSG